MSRVPMTLRLDLTTPQMVLYVRQAVEATFKRGMMTEAERDRALVTLHRAWGQLRAASQAN